MLPAVVYHWEITLVLTQITLFGTVQTCFVECVVESFQAFGWGAHTPEKYRSTTNASPQRARQLKDQKMVSQCRRDRFRHRVSTASACFDEMLTLHHLLWRPSTGTQREAHRDHMNAHGERGNLRSGKQLCAVEPNSNDLRTH